MGAECFSAEPRPTCDPGTRGRSNFGSRLRWVHRWTSIVFTLTVAANFAAVIRGPVPALITYSPLLILMPTGLYIFARASASKLRWPAPATSKG